MRKRDSQNELTVWGKRAYAVFVLCATAATALPAQTLTTLFRFDSTDGSWLQAGLIQGAEGNLYGTTITGGANDGPDCFPSFCGTVFEITPGGTLTTLYNFCSQSGCMDGYNPYAGLVQATNGDFYGTTNNGGLTGDACNGFGCGTVFKITPSGALTTLYNFCSQNGCTDGIYPQAGLIQATSGELYGTTTSGGANHWGTVFKITPGGALTTLYSFCSQSGCPDGDDPEAALVEATDGDFYGTTSGGVGLGVVGGVGYGTVFKMTPSGALTTLHSFCAQSGCPDGAHPWAGLVQAANGDLYGTTLFGGANDGPNCVPNGCGTVFKIAPSGTLTTLYSFCSQADCTDGFFPEAGLVQATDGDLYGTTAFGGNYNCLFGPKGCGAVFKITPSGTLTTLYNFCSQTNCTDGTEPYAGLVQATNGEFYGTTVGGGIDDSYYGTIFSLSVGLGPFVETQPTSGKVGATVKILGTNLAGASSVVFNGTPAVVGVSSGSETEIAVTVPAGATTGEVQVITPSGALLSNVVFRVLP